MNSTKIKTLITSAIVACSLYGCDSIPFIDTTPDYKAASKSRPLEVPPDLTSASASDTYSVPGGSTSYSTYSQGQAEQENQKDILLPTPDNVKLERAGSQRWLVVKAPPEKVWPVIRDFWAELGFAVRVENTQTGVMETEWVDPSSITKDDKGNYLDKFQGWLDKLNSLQTRQKFRTRLDRGQDEGTTEIYMSHQALGNTNDDGIERVMTSAGVVENGYKLQKKSESRSKADDSRSDAEDLDAELLRRLMVRLGIEEKKSRTIMATSNNEVRATIKQDADKSVVLAVNDQFDRAWRRVGLALDRIGFVVEDKDRSNGIYFVRYADVDIDDSPQKKKGLLSSLKFWGDDDKKDADPEATKKEDKGLTEKLKFWNSGEKDKVVDPAKQYRVKVEDAGSGSQITVVDKDGKRNRSTTANRILSLLYEQLK